jgi:alpha-1,6-mannosyltransferase
MVYGRLVATLAIVPCALLAGGLAARVALVSAPHVIATDLAQPIPVVTGWQNFGAGLWALLAITVVVAAAATLAGLRCLRDPRLDARVAFAIVGATVLAALAAALSWPVMFSSDIYAYAAYGVEALRGLDPYAHPPMGASDPLIAAAAWQWGGTFPICVYGGAFVAFARTIVAATHGQSPAATLLAFRLAACAAFAVASVALFAVWPRSDPRRLVVVAAFALNPVAVWSAAEGHNDVLMLALALVGAAAAVRWQLFGGGVVIGLSSLIKAPGVVTATAVAWFVLLAFERKLRRLLVGVAVGGLAAAAVGLPRALALVTEFGQHGRYAPQFSLQALAAAAARGLFAATAAPAVGIAVALFACAGIGLYGAAQLRSRDGSGLAWIAIALWLAIPNPYPWYALWVLPVAALALERPPFAALWAATISIVLRYLPDAHGALPPDQQLVIAAVQLVPLIFALRPARVPRPAHEAAPT